ncbi:Hypothetical predicted protein [Paramuricea clavata]|uniref:Uncharacterized protein n=2 Tax=Paramuricea clavata TaxID=317549 RepID=A0A7D9HG05_PARCT|nr:Hypothetical predicted protein [Paramuricea clavata]
MNCKLLLFTILLITSINRAGSGPITCYACMESTTTYCATAVLSAAHCSAWGWCPPLWFNCVMAVIGTACGVAYIGCAVVCMAPTV